MISLIQRRDDGAILGGRKVFFAISVTSCNLCCRGRAVCARVTPMIGPGSGEKVMSCPCYFASSGYIIFRHQVEQDRHMAMSGELLGDSASAATVGTAIINGVSDTYQD